jgi:hypothetical protein
MWSAVVVSDAENKVSLEELQVRFNREVETDTRAAAETAYALAFRYRNEDVGGNRRFDVARIWATRAIELLDSLPSGRLDQVASTRSSVGGIALPELLHSGVVRQRLGDVLI